jgi:hypothetical protein
MRWYPPSDAERFARRVDIPTRIMDGEYGDTPELSAPELSEADLENMDPIEFGDVSHLIREDDR